MDRGAWRATVHRVAYSQTQLKRLSRHTCSLLHQHPLIFSNLKRMSQAGINKDAFFEHNSCFLGKIHDLYLGLFHRTPPSFHIW